MTRSQFVLESLLISLLSFCVYSLGVKEGEKAERNRRPATAQACRCRGDLGSIRLSGPTRAVEAN